MSCCHPLGAILKPLSRQITNVTEDKGSPSPSLWCEVRGMPGRTEPEPRISRSRGRREREGPLATHLRGPGPCHPDHYAIIITYRHSEQSQQGSVLHSRRPINLQDRGYTYCRAMLRYWAKRQVCGKIHVAEIRWHLLTHFTTHNVALRTAIPGLLLQCTLFSRALQKTWISTFRESWNCIILHVLKREINYRKGDLISHQSWI